MYTEIITKESDNPDTVQLFIEKSMQSLVRMEELVQSLLKMMRLDAKAITFEKQLCSVVTLVKRAEEPLKIRAAAEKKQFLLEGKAEEYVFCDPIWTSEAIGNLLKNALEHTDAGENIHIFWESSLTMFRIFIKDNGCGIAAEDFYHIFKRFYRSLSSTERTGCRSLKRLWKDREESCRWKVKWDMGRCSVLVCLFKSLRFRKLIFMQM